MVCGGGQTCLIWFNFYRGGKDRFYFNSTFLLRQTTTGKDLYDYIEEYYQIQADTFKLYLVSPDKVIDLSEMKDKTMSEVGVDVSYDRDSNARKHTIIVADPADNLLPKSELSYALTSYNPATVGRSPLQSSVWSEDNAKIKAFTKPETNYVGLVNQAMTCYLNSLLQALYMTPEFRNALYNWEYVDGSEKDEFNSIPYQLQKLFLNLQTSTKSAVETTSLTKSFGWDSTEAWQQHDIQELCRVMFDALEQKFKNTEQADLINRLYEGKMIDYVKCLECGTEKSREDAFLDIPLPVRPFGSNVAYNSVEEALRAFVQYETLEGNNQYHCEKCNKKCDAHKGLKFTKFPYLLTLHLKRFDFDFKTFHRFKLNDRVTFPDVLNLNPFVSSTANQESPAGEEDIGLSVKCDDSSTTDSGTLDDDCPPCESSLSNSNYSTNHDQDDDEGIDMSNGPSTSNCTAHNHENEKNRGNCSAKGPYQYELFSIMIHSGSASGGHYYAYIKDFRTQEWLSFNDQIVTQITHDEIQKTYGGGPTRPYYSSGINAYMLMYRQIDHVRNALPMQAQDFPKHIQELLRRMKESEDNDKKNHEKQMSLPKLKIYCHHPAKEMLLDVQLYVMPEITWADATEMAYKRFNLEDEVSLDQCRLVSYDHEYDLIVCSYEGREQETVVKPSLNQNRFNLLLEIRGKDEQFETYLPGGISSKVYVIDVPTEDILEGPLNVRCSLTQTLKEYKEMLSKIVNMEPGQMKIIMLQSSEPILLENEEKDLDSLGFYNTIKVFVSAMLDTETKPFNECKICDVIENLMSVIWLNVQLPDTSSGILEDLNIPPLLEEKCKEPEKPIASSPSKLSVDESHCDVAANCNDTSRRGRYKNAGGLLRNMSPQMAGENEEWNTPEQSNSEDSSLSDSDKTLVGDAPDSQGLTISYGPDVDTIDRPIEMLNDIGISDWDKYNKSEYYFKATPRANSNQKLLKVLVDIRMKVDNLKKKLEPYVGVPVEYFKIFSQSSDFGEMECTSMLQFMYYPQGERIKVKLGRVLRSGEFKVKLFQFFMDAIEPYKFLCEWIITKDMTVGQVKKEILAEIKRKYDIDIPFDRCRLRKKYFKQVSKVFLDEQKFEDFRLDSQMEMVLQELPDKEPVTNSNQTVLFARRWSPENVRLEKFQEIVMDGDSIEEMRKKLSAISDIPEKYIDIARAARDSFPFNISVLRIQDQFDWNKLSPDLSHIEDGLAYLYRDNRESLKSLTAEEVKEITTKEAPRILPGMGRRKALKIYLDSQ